MKKYIYLATALALTVCFFVNALLYMNDRPYMFAGDMGMELFLINILLGLLFYMLYIKTYISEKKVSTNEEQLMKSIRLASVGTVIYGTVVIIVIVILKILLTI